ncbi:uncharacterized protein BJ171DRAFT_517999 [Polychytrium aggregatum]|uniref:uncharacterized protein n=1 Tax=Polychytrium aggregatum TaxID=110093 RepID=UPI0022FE92B4|nr:uncharacterized protein BJ171DRAFT_517999 [Polychytrium aggregatum]KAI9199586.1 hypothetical protein BJ171DRAFT_517999 [Polychytrium aggregatum]
MRLRCRSSKGVHAIGASLGASSTVLELKTEICAIAGIDAARLQLKMGFPPKPISIANDSITLASLGIKDGEQVIAEELPTASAVELPQPWVSQAQSASPSQRLHVQAPSGSNVTKTAAGEGIRLPDGIVLVKEMKDDNNCLFRSISYAMEGTSERYPLLRKVVADAIIADPFRWNEAILGKSPHDYAAWIQKPQSWGGAIELVILSEYYQVDISSIDVSTVRVDRFGEGKYSNRIFVLYSGIHYDVIAMSPADNAPEEFFTRTFTDTAELVATAAVQLAQIWKAKRKFTDLANFTLRCSVCKIGLHGQKEAQDHATKTGHTSFTEY